MEIPIAPTKNEYELGYLSISMTMIKGDIALATSFDPCDKQTIKAPKIWRILNTSEISITY
jgi:hypothetical protein